MTPTHVNIHTQEKVQLCGVLFTPSGKYLLVKEKHRKKLTRWPEEKFNACHQSLTKETSE